MRKKRVALAGLGTMGRIHAARILRTAGLELAAVVTRTPPEPRRPAGGAEGDAQAMDRVPHFTDWTRALDAVRAEVAVIATPLHCHAAMAEAALERECDVFLEKPFTLDLEAGERLIASAEGRGRILFIAHCVQFMKEYRFVVDRIRSGDLGDLVHWELERSSGRPAGGSWEEPEVLGTCGGGLFDLVVHDIDIARVALGAPDSIEGADSFRNTFGPQKVDAVWTYPGRPALVRIRGGFFEPPGVPFRAAFTAEFREGAVVCRPELGAGVTVVTREGARRLEFDDNDSYFNEMLYFEECVRARRAPEWGGARGALETIRLCYRHGRPEPCAGVRRADAGHRAGVRAPPGHAAGAGGE